MTTENAREDFAGREVQTLHETASTAVAAQARAAVESRYIMAMKRPRDIDEVRARILRECQRPQFAQVARYRKPIGKGVEGLSIRFAEAALRLMGNILIESPVVYDDATKRIVRVTVTDLETNTTYGGDATIEKVVERRKLRDGQSALYERTNSEGETVYGVAATEDDLLNKIGAAISKSIRNHGLRLIPGDILAEAEDAVKATLGNQAAKDPDGERKRLADAFAAINVGPGQLKHYLGHPLEQCSPLELTDLRLVYQTIKDQETTWAAVMEEREKAEEGPQRAKAGPVTDAERKVLMQAIKRNKHDAKVVDQWLAVRWKVASLADITREQYAPILARLEDPTPLGELPEDDAPATT